MPLSEKFWMKTSSINTLAAPLLVILMPLSPVAVPAVPLVPAPLIERPRSRTERSGSFTFPAGMLMMTPVVPLARIEPCVSSQSMVIDLAMVTGPNPPGSRQLISPLMAVFEIAPENVWHGAVLLHGLTSLPVPETHVRVACASADAEQTANIATAAIGPNI